MYHVKINLQSALGLSGKTTGKHQIEEFDVMDVAHFERLFALFPDVRVSEEGTAGYGGHKILKNAMNTLTMLPIGEIIPLEDNIA